MKHLKLYHIIIFLCISGSYSCRTIKPDFPQIPQQTIVFDDPPVSKIYTNDTVDFSPKVAELDADLNTALVFSGGQNDCNLSYSFSVQKSGPLNIAFGQAPNFPLNFSTQISAGAGATFCAVCVNFFGVRCIVPKIGASCGINGEPLRRISVSLSSVLDINPDYSLKSSTQLGDLYFIDPCRVTFLNIDISGIIVGQARSKIPLNKVDQVVGTISIQPTMQNAWTKLSQKIQVADGLYLKIHPEEISKSKISGAGQSAYLTVGLQAKPEITTDPSDPTVQTLPPLQTNSGANGFNIFSDIKIDYPFLSNQLSQAFKDKEFGADGKKIIVKKIQVFGSKNRELIIRVDFKGDVRGCIYVLGVPNYDDVNRQVKFTNLKYDVLTNNKLLDAAAWLLKPAVLPAMEEKTKVNIGSYIDNNIGIINGYLNKEYSNNISTSGKINSINIVPNNFQALSNFFLIRGHALGELNVKVKL
jgi:hypothetical protein